MSDDNHDTFRRDWAYVSEVLSTLSSASRYDIYPLPGVYTTGRPKYEAVFMTADCKKVIARREAMQLQSRRTGAYYYVCRRHEDWPWRAAKATQPQQALETAGFDVDDIFIR